MQCVHRKWFGSAVCEQRDRYYIYCHNQHDPNHFRGTASILIVNKLSLSTRGQIVIYVNWEAIIRNVFKWCDRLHRNILKVHVDRKKVPSYEKKVKIGIFFNRPDPYAQNSANYCSKEFVRIWDWQVKKSSGPYDNAWSLERR